MIISRTPFRISFAGGGSDLPDYYLLKAGCVLNTAINKYMYITVHPPFDQRIRLKYAKTELVDVVEAVEHPIIREALQLVGIESGIEITSVSDIPAQAGLGSSSSFAVGLLHALHAFKGEHVSSEQLAAEACDIEQNRLAEPVGKQDQYAAAYGGMNFMRFNTDNSVFVEPIVCPQAKKEKLHERLMLFHCSGVRSAREILTDQKEHVPDRMKEWDRMVELAHALREIMTSGADVDGFGEIMHEGWMLKREMGTKITTGDIDAWYDKALKAGASGGKLLGAGGGGFLLFVVEPEKQEGVRQALADLRQIDFMFELQGSKIIHVS